MSLPFASGASRSSRPFEARFPGICEHCQEGFEEGEEVMYDGSDLVHADPDGCSQFRERPIRRPCIACRLVHAGECF